jgi:hypothetical protein
LGRGESAEQPPRRDPRLLLAINAKWIVKAFGAQAL